MQLIKIPKTPSNQTRRQRLNRDQRKMIQQALAGCFKLAEAKNPYPNTLKGIIP